MLKLGGAGLRVVAAIARVLGFAPYVLDGAAEYRPSKTLSTYSTALCVVGSTTAFVFNLWYQDKEATARTALLIWRVLFVLEIATRTWVLSTRTFPRLWLVLNSEPIRKGAPRVAFGSALCVFSMSIAFCILTWFFWSEYLSFLSLWYLGAVVQALFMLHRAVPIIMFSVLLHCLSERFRALNDNLREYYVLSKKQKTTQFERLCHKGYITDFRAQHRRTVAAIHDLTFSYGPSIVVDGLSDLWLLVYTFYTMFEYTSTVGNYFNITLVVSVFLRWAYLLSTAARVSMHGNATLPLGNDMYQDCVLTPGEQQEIQLILESLNYIPVRVTILGELDLNISLFFQVIASGIGYIIILLQFKGTANCSDRGMNATSLPSVQPTSSALGLALATR